jgi:hypothetical protein
MILRREYPFIWGFRMSVHFRRYFSFRHSLNTTRQFVRLASWRFSCLPIASTGWLAGWLADWMAGWLAGLSQSDNESRRHAHQPFWRTMYICSPLHVILMKSWSSEDICQTVARRLRAFGYLICSRIYYRACAKSWHSIKVFVVNKSQNQISRFRDIRLLHWCIVSNGLSSHRTP